MQYEPIFFCHKPCAPPDTHSLQCATPTGVSNLLIWQFFTATNFSTLDYAIQLSEMQRHIHIWCTLSLSWIFSCTTFNQCLVGCDTQNYHKSQLLDGLNSNLIPHGEACSKTYSHKHALSIIHRSLGWLTHHPGISKYGMGRAVHPSQAYKSWNSQPMCKYNYNPDDPWNGLFWSTLLISIDKEAKAMRSGNAHIHRLTHVTPASIAYIVTQVSNICHWSHHVSDGIHDRCNLC